jgi:hypothetical protein
MTKKYILEFLHQHKKQLQENYGVTKIGLFGSYAREEAQEDSDIDIVVELDSKNSFRSFFALLHFLEDSLQKKIDLGIEHSMKKRAYDSMLKDIVYV